MVSGVAALSLAFAAVHLCTFLNSQTQCGPGTKTCDEAPLLDSAAEAVAGLLPLAALAVLFVAVVLTYRHLMARHDVGAAPVARAANGRRSISGLVMFVLCVSAGTFEFVVFGHEQATGGGGGAGHDAQALRTLGLAALRALPASATATFFLGMMLIVAGAVHVRAAAEAGGTGAVAGDGPVQGPLRLLTKVAAAALVGLMAIALALHGAKY